MRIWMTLMAGKGSLEDIRELWEPIKTYFNGLVCTYHGDREDEEAQYLESAKGEGRIIYLPYSGRHDHSRNTYLWCGPIEQGDWCCQADTLERPNVTFLSLATGPSRHMLTDKHGRYPNIYYFHSKPFLFQYHESMRYKGTPHEMLVREDGGGRGFELNGTYPNEADVRENVRPLKRKDPYGWVGHYVRYYLSIPWGGNHCLLGNEHRGDPMMLYREREQVRIEVRDYLRGLGVPLTEGGLRKLFSEPLSAKMIEYVNKERILNDAYRYWALNDLTVRDDHTWTGMVQFPLDTKDQSG